MNKKVSIIIPVFNAEKYLSETINSVKNQIFLNWECIIINDGSSDKSEEIALKNIAEDIRFNYVFQENTGVCIARNNAVKLSVGEYILCLDADDLISDNFLDETVKVLESDLTIKVATSTVNFFGRSKGVMKVVSYDLGTLLAENQIVVTSLFRRLDYERVGGFNENMKEGFEDWDFWISILKNGGTVQCASEATFFYRLLNVSRNSGISYDKEKKLRSQMWKNHQELFSEYFVDPLACFEYKRVANSIEYKVGNILLWPIRKIKLWVVYLNEKLN